MKRTRLAARRKTVGLSQEKLAEALGVDRSTVLRWERGTTGPQPWHRPRLAELLKISLDELAELLERGAVSTSIHREAPALAGIDADAIDVARRRYEQMYRQVGGIVVGPRIELLLAQRVAPALRATRDDRDGRRLRRSAASLIAVAGICAYDAADYQRASGHFARARQLAESAGDPALAGYVSALTANQALCLGKHQLTVHLTSSALASGQGALSAALRTDLHAMQAKAYAQMGASAQCRQHMRHAEHQVELIRPADEPAETSYVHPGLMELKHAESMLHIGELREAQLFAEMSMQLGPSDPRGQFYNHVTLAMILAKRREVESGLAWAHGALEIARGMESARVRGLVARLVGVLRPFSTEPAARDFIAEAERDLAATF